MKALVAVAATASLVLVGAGTASGVDPDPTYPTGTFTVNGGNMLNGCAGGAGDPFTVGSVEVDSLSDDNTPTNRIRLALDLRRDQGGSGIWELRPRGVPDGENKGIHGWDAMFDNIGTYTPTVTITDRDNHQTVMVLPKLAVLADTTPPAGGVSLPAASLRHSVRGWTRLHGTASDPESGIYQVVARVLQRRGGVWYAYNERKGRWTRGTRSEAATLKRTSWMDASTGTGTWRLAPLKRLTKGLLVVRTELVNDGCGPDPRTEAPVVRYQITKR